MGIGFKSTSVAIQILETTFISDPLLLFCSGDATTYPPNLIPKKKKTNLDLSLNTLAAAAAARVLCGGCLVARKETFTTSAEQMTIWKDEKDA
jgi:hypothetical protein